MNFLRNALFKANYLNKISLYRCYSTPVVKSSVTVGTRLAGINYRVDKEEVFAKEDSEYPDWLWTLLDEAPKDQIPLRKQIKIDNIDKIKRANFMKAKKK
ncbi:hypothetical protein BB561_003121 [Smittium simulii]|uniref:Large ribosomal subunit protein mL54 n=1 Tax=Smittium simulii TaxID=133385 RepID=A0A2T9YMW8_9FUNG|nr:hypothetical protein BB561_003121 [Smittium simulii]